MIPALLAQAATAPLDDSALATGLKLLAWGLAVIALAVVIWKNSRPYPAAAEVYATKEETRSMKEEAKALAHHIHKTDEKIDQLRVDVARNYSDLQASDEARTSVLHRRLDSMQEVLRQISEKVGAANHA